MTRYVITRLWEPKVIDGPEHVFEARWVLLRFEGTASEVVSYHPTREDARRNRDAVLVFTRGPGSKAAHERRHRASRVGS